MDIEIKIGTEVGGPGACLVPKSYTFVSRWHATILWHDGLATIEDRSTNGTYVNGQRVSRANISANDMVWLGPPSMQNSYQLDVMRIFASFPNTGSMSAPSPMPSMQTPAPGYNPMPQPRYGDDYSMDFARIKQAYIEYHEQMSKIRKKANNKNLLPRILVSTIPALLGITVLLISKDMTMRIIAMSAGSVLSVVLGSLTMGRGGSSNEKMQEQILDLQIKYQKQYRCPKCGKDFNLEQHWKKLQADGKCPYGCGARFV